MRCGASASTDQTKPAFSLPLKLSQTLLAARAAERLSEDHAGPSSPAFFKEALRLHQPPGFDGGFWSLAKVMGAWLAFAKGSNQFSISHLIQMGFFGLSLQQPEEVTGRRPHGLGVAPRRQTVKVLGAPIPEDPDVSPQEHGIGGDQKRWRTGQGLGVAHLGLADAQECFLIAKV